MLTDSTAQPTAPRKRLVIISASAGAGLGLMLAIIAGAVVWYNSRPKPQKPWDSMALKAAFESTGTTGKQSASS